MSTGMSNELLLVRGILAATCLAWSLSTRAEEPAETAAGGEAAKRQDRPWPPPNWSRRQWKMKWPAATTVARPSWTRPSASRPATSRPTGTPARSEAGKWQRPAEVERHARQDPRLGRIPATAGGSQGPVGGRCPGPLVPQNPAGRRGAGGVEAVLSIEPDHAEAIKALGPVATRANG